MRKTYFAVARGHPPASGTVDHPLHEPCDKRFASHSSSESPLQPAVTHFRTRGCTVQLFAIGPYSKSRYALFEATTEAGRYHQVRRHLNRIHHRIIGDNGHGDYRHNRFFREHLGCRRLLLHAWAIETVHPVNGVPFVVRAPVPDDFAGVLDRLGLPFPASG
jgi:tRNA pseudouridine65 synthase